MKKRKLVEQINQYMHREKEISPFEKTVMVDFDGTIHKYSKGFHNGKVYDEPFEGAKEALETLKNKGYKIIIYTARICPGVNDDRKQQIEDIKQWLDKYDIPYDDLTYKKYPADLYIDDRGYRFEGDWKNEIQTILDLLEKNIE
ncbi:MAG: hypothetical protein KatS3mg002_0273 [Candidatus Woesearchaeota archaeon]|nr:MAG: hypothetical protein KatS3mg002_0273 [Candidatus Woesearchaeota archaeon]